MMIPPVRQTLADGRHHFSHGPIDLVIAVDGASGEVARALGAAWARFEQVLAELVGELPALRAPAGTQDLSGPVARRMAAAVTPFAGDRFVTPMAAVAGAVADEIRAVIDGTGRFDRIHVNNGGDISLCLRGTATLRVGLAPDLGAADIRDTVDLTAGDRIGGVATSGRHGRSFSRGIADAVTVLADDAATADAAATLIANAVDVPSDKVRRKPAIELDPDSDLGARPVTVDVAPLDKVEVTKALDAGASLAHEYLRRGLIRGAALYLQDAVRVVGGPGSRLIRVGEAA